MHYFRLMPFVILIVTVPIQYGYSLEATAILNNDLPVLKDPALKTEAVFNGIQLATSMAFLGPNDILVLEKNNGTVKRIVDGIMQKEPLLDVNVANKGERGMLGIAISNSTVGHTYVYLYYTQAETRDGDDNIEGSDPLGNRLYRYELVNNKLVNPRLFLDLPARPGPFHNGGAVIIGPDNNTYTVIGDLYGQQTNASSTKAQNYVNGVEPDGRSGILRLTQEGKIVGDGIIGNMHPLDLYYAYGIRNSFGIDFDPLTGNLWDTENGPEYGDEINFVGPGFNSGWIKTQGFWIRTADGIKQQPVVVDDLVDLNGKGKYSPPEFSWNKSTGVTGIKFLSSDKYGEQYENDLFVADTRGRLYHFDLIENRTQLQLQGNVSDRIANTDGELQEVTFGKGFGVITDLEVGPDGYLYILTLAGTIFRVIPTIDEKVNLTEQDYVWKPTDHAKVLQQSGNLTVYVDIPAADKTYSRAALETQINSTRTPSILSLDLKYSSKSVAGNGTFYAEIRDIQNTEGNQDNVVWSRTLNNTDGKVINETFNPPKNITNTPLEIRMYVISDGPGEHVLTITNASIIASYPR